MKTRYGYGKKSLMAMLAATFVVSSIIGSTGRASVKAESYDDAYAGISLVGEETSEEIVDEPMYAFPSQGMDNATYQHDDKFQGTTVRKGVDVSHWQGNIDWNALKSSGVEFAIIKLAERRAADGVMIKDEMGEKNLREAQQAGIKVGVYCFSQATTYDEGKEEAEYILGLVNGRYLDLPIVIDYEYRSKKDGNRVDQWGNPVYVKWGKLYDAHLSKEQATSAVNGFCDRVKANGYTAMLYANLSMLRDQLNPENIYNTNYVWVARYGSSVSGSTNYKYNGKYNFWQYSESLSGIPGVNTSSLDGDFWYDDGLSMALNRTGLFYQGDDICYFKNGHRDYSLNSVEKCKDKWYYVKNGKVDLSYTGLAKNGNGWWYCKNGVVDMGYNGLCANQNGTWYVKGGKVQFDYTGVAKCTNTSKNGQSGKSTTYNGWYSIVNGQLSTAENVLKNDNGWWYCKNGMVDFSANTIAKNSNGWWYVVDGKVDFGYTGIARNNNGDYYIKGGKAQLETTGVVKSDKKKQGSLIFDGWYFVKNGRVVYNQITTGKNSNGTWYIGKDGKVDFSINDVVKTDEGWLYVKGGQVMTDYTGIARNANGDWYVKNGKVQLGLNDIVKSETNDRGNVFSGWYYVKDGKVAYDVTSVEKNSNGWWYIKDGKVDFSANTVAKNGHGWWCIQNGKVTFDYNGIAANENGDWYIKDSKVDFSYNGLAHTDKGDYYVEGGKVNYFTTGVIKCPKTISNGVTFEGWYNIVEGKVLHTTTLAENANGVWYIKDGKVDFSYNGIFEFDGVKYEIKDGKVIGIK